MRNDKGTCVTPERMHEAAAADPPILERDELRHLVRCESCLDAWSDLRDGIKEDDPEV